MEIDFSKLSFVREKNIKVPDWIYPLKIRYGILKLSMEKYLIWNVIGTQKIFRISLKTITTNHSTDYSAHFVLTLSNLRSDILSWMDEGLPEDWMKEYYKQFKNFILY